MDQIKIGRFIAERRKGCGLTQMQLAEQMNVSDRAVSKWETGKAMPDSSIMLELCAVLGITVNDLLCGEVVTMENYNKQLEERLVELVKEKEASDRRLLRIEIVAGIMSVVPLIAAIVIANVVPMEEWLASLIVGVCLIPLLVATPFMIRIEQTAGYYECAKCGHKYIPKYASVLMAMHSGRTRYMKCPACGKRSWQKKRIGKDKE
ncbi:MAG: helix-turn-helix transcriptional regulator [Clostridia bacterium]|nr:helix-turn-helix transcriptional regulator [Clostridia bacterium]